MGNQLQCAAEMLDALCRDWTDQERLYPGGVIVSSARHNGTGSCGRFTVNVPVQSEFTLYALDVRLGDVRFRRRLLAFSSPRTPSGQRRNKNTQFYGRSAKPPEGPTAKVGADGMRVICSKLRTRHAEETRGDRERNKPSRHNRRSENGRGGRNGSSGDSRGGPHNSAEDGRTPATEFQVACDGGADKSGS